MRTASAMTHMVLKGNLGMAVSASYLVVSNTGTDVQEAPDTMPKHFAAYG